MKKLLVSIISIYVPLISVFADCIKTVKREYKSYLRSMAIFFGLLMTMMFFQDAFAGTDGDDFAEIYTRLQQWSQGSLGKVVSLGMFLVGLSIGVIQQSIIAVVVGISGAMALYYGPTIISSVVSAVI